MEAELNMVNKIIIGNRIIKKAEAMHEIPTENTGGRKYRSADEVGLSRLLLYDNQCQNMRDSILNSENNHTCYR